MNIYFRSDLSQFQYLPLFIKEVMRFYSPVPLVARKHYETITIDGIEIPPGPRIDICIHAIHHNPEVWKSPEVSRCCLARGLYSYTAHINAHINCNLSLC